MANIKSAKKRILQDKKKTMKNKIVVSKTKTTIKAYQKHHDLTDPEKLIELKKRFDAAIKYIDKATSKGVFHKNKSARLKSRLYFHFMKTKKEVSSTKDTASSTSSVSSTK